MEREGAANGDSRRLVFNLDSDVTVTIRRAV